MAPGNQPSLAMVPTLSGLLFAAGTTLYWLMHPVWPWRDWFQRTPFTQMLIEPGYMPASLAHVAGWLSVVYSPTTWYQTRAWKRLQAGCQSAAEPSPAPGLNTYAERRLQRLSELVVL